MPASSTVQQCCTHLITCALGVTSALSAILAAGYKDDVYIPQYDSARAPYEQHQGHEHEHEHDHGHDRDQEHDQDHEHDYHEEYEHEPGHKHSYDYRGHEHDYGYGYGYGYKKKKYGEQLLALSALRVFLPFSFCSLFSNCCASMHSLAAKSALGLATVIQAVHALAMCCAGTLS